MDYKRYMKGLYMIGRLTEVNDGEAAAFFLTDDGQSLVRDTFIEHARRANEDDPNSGGVGMGLDGEEAFKRLDDTIRYRLQKEIDAITEQVEEAHAADQKEASNLRNQPHAAGTTAELAAKLGVSKSEVRKMKREGKLEAALEKLETSNE